jgi:putative membrane protein
MIVIPGTPGYIAGAGFWLWLKLLLVIGLLGAHIAMMSWKNAFAQDQNQHPQRFFRIVNEIPTLLMVGIVICVVVKPF